MVKAEQVLGINANSNQDYNLCIGFVDQNHGGNGGAASADGHAWMRRSVVVAHRCGRKAQGKARAHRRRRPTPPPACRTSPSWTMCAWIRASCRALCSRTRTASRRIPCPPWEGPPLAPPGSDLHRHRSWKKNETTLAGKRQIDGAVFAMNSSDGQVHHDAVLGSSSENAAVHDAI